MTSDPQTSVQSIPDEQVIPVLALVLDARRRLPDAATAKQTCERLSAAAADPAPLEIVDEQTGPADASPSDLNTGSTAPSDTALARTALGYLVTTDPEAARVLPRALRLANEPDTGTTRFDPMTLLIGGLVLAVLQTEVDWTRTDTGRWKLRVHKRAMRDSTIATLIRGVLTGNGPGTGAPQ
ncbi:hypothetical protein [Blastococcus montanus]|uniref:hypothetical protein n=1 Tax=Blastococcus montanus TaxID=3144973 RepID=UPI003208CF13